MSLSRESIEAMRASLQSSRDYLTLSERDIDDLCSLALSALAPVAQPVATINDPDMITVRSNAAEVIRIAASGQLFWHGREVETDDGFRAAMKELAEFMAKNMRAAPQAQPGMVLVPREPTPEMIQAWHDRFIEGAGYIDRNSVEYALYVECYAAMLAAAQGER